MCLAFTSRYHGPGETHAGLIADCQSLQRYLN